MTPMFSKPLTFAAALVAAAALSGAAQAGAVSGNFGSTGWSALSVSVPSDATVDFLFTGGYVDATFSLFDGTGAHLITNDDTATSLNPHLTQNLLAGSYTLLISYFGTSLSYADSTGAIYANNDGFNSGSYWVGGTGSLTGMKSYLDANTYDGVAGAQWSINIRNADVGGQVPEPGVLALLSLALAGLALARRHN
jgi:hypothetical protein